MGLVSEIQSLRVIQEMDGKIGQQLVYVTV